eukprot:TRINITY_DN21224_c0_g1_i1.p1 TRINITY_DN21224_c0_g1~~TRINITY_DN21224_c0_g1_i1.p1  ORF type:complete len:373 (-),score=87.92 TRINITY_DN21224_c0_g1_i1:903-1952(-)
MPASPMTMPFAARAFLSRWGASKEDPRWSSYIPAHVRLTGVLSANSSRSTLGDQEADCCQTSSDGDVVARSIDKQQEADRERGAALAAAVLGRVWVLSQHRHGCWKVQEALELAESDEIREQIAEELEGHVWEALQCPHANHVLQKCITHLRPQALPAIVTELMSKENAVEEAARHKFGCRILQRLLEHCRPWHVREIVEELVVRAPSLSCDPYGNYVMQDFIEHGTAAQLTRLVQAVEPEAPVLGSDPYGSAVLYKAMCNVGVDDQVTLARALLRAPDILVCMACSRHGYLSVVRACQLLDGEEGAEVRSLLAAHANKLCKSKYGQAVYHRLLTQQTSKGSFDESASN